MTRAVRFAAFAAVLFAVFLAGCTFTVNPADLAPPRATLTRSSPISSLSASPAPSTSGTVLLTVAEVAKHNTFSDCWMIIRGNGYNLSSFATHPGGAAYIPYCGTDGTQAYADKGGRGRPHSAAANAMLPNFLIGALGQPLPA